MAGGKTAFVFAGGSSLGAIQVGMLKALLARGYQADMVIGSSVGAINAAYFAGDPTPGGVSRLEAIWRALRRSDVFPASALGGLMRLFTRRGYLVAPTGIAQLIQRSLRYQRLEEAKIPCHIIATDLLAGTELRLSSGPALPALLASAAIPGIFPAQRIGDHYIIDGGVANHTPISAAVDLGATRLIVLPTGYSCALAEPPKRAIGAALHGLNILIARQVTRAVRSYRSQVEILVAPPLCPLDVLPYDFSACGKLIDRAAAGTAQWLDHGVEMVDGVPHQLPPHSHSDSAQPYGPHRLV